MILVINENNLEKNDINEFSSKVRCILINDNNEILVCKYGETYLLPGGKIDNGESQVDALIRELNEETGILYSENDFKFLYELNYYQKDYPKRDNEIKINRLVTTYYYLGKYKEINLDKQILSDKEINSNFRLELINLDNIENIIINNHNSNPRNSYFQKELLVIIEKYKKINK
jgi:8-oxo-dGTP pyrophosphatase MutT (NUDIX family)